MYFLEVVALDVKQSEHELQGKLHLSSRASGGDPSEAWGLHIRARPPKVGMIKSVEGFGPELQIRGFGQTKSIV